MEFFCAPRRGGKAVLMELYKKFDNISIGIEEANKEQESLGDNSDFIFSCYSRDIVPESFSFFDSKDEFAILEKYLISYRR
jgi:hypothetical protein